MVHTERVAKPRFAEATIFLKAVASIAVKVFTHIAAKNYDEIRCSLVKVLYALPCVCVVMQTLEPFEKWPLRVAMAWKAGFISGKVTKHAAHE